jgi:hypothetical protein
MQCIAKPTLPCWVLKIELQCQISPKLKWGYCQNIVLHIAKTFQEQCNAAIVNIPKKNKQWQYFIIDIVLSLRQFPKIASILHSNISLQIWHCKCGIANISCLNITHYTISTKSLESALVCRRRESKKTISVKWERARFKRKNALPRRVSALNDLNWCQIQKGRSLPVCMMMWYLLDPRNSFFFVFKKKRKKKRER